jgi:hypothetical protein
MVHGGSEAELSGEGACVRREMEWGSAIAYHRTEIRSQPMRGGSDRHGRHRRVVSAVTGEMVGARDWITGFSVNAVLTH